MKHFSIIAATLLATGTAWGQTAVQPPAAPAAAAASTVGAAATTPQPARNVVSSPDARSAAALALSDQPTFDTGTAARLLHAIVSYSEIARSGGWPSIPADAKFALGVNGSSDALLRLRLIVTGDLAADKASGAYDKTLADAVKHFQARHGLPTTGMVGPLTLAALNVQVQKRVQQLEASLERIKQMGFGFGPRYVVVNLPAAYAEAIENDVVVRRYRVIVGKTEKPSPTLIAEISNVNLNPTWTVPTSITRNEIAAHMRKDPTYLTRMHMQLLDSKEAVIDPATVDWSQTPNFTVRQVPGEWNALGQVRIDMPNNYAVYMHDTNQKNLFTDDYRFDSHGCARIDNVRDLAAWILKDLPKWDRAAIDAKIASGERETIKLPTKIPVAWTYLTGWMTRDNTVNFRNDIYDQDAQLVEATAEEEAFFGKAAQPVAR
ncbi:L,D-transpeptidase family protein [Rhodopseudomonas sp. P2A-2r]|uniref:L,D-transpeptidase family protein n=1 Tax=unclassified Rhodopseudomonas TaxID=2638247 RepID=UPI002233FD80|nr:L,D-transpeptidase family protein [Rhodopseudomonas sp. P2A-2r]UZE49601.1 L,D-transpeptidase family protein [Rhodopseudomonas sp. P2A-2r]